MPESPIEFLDTVGVRSIVPVVYVKNNVLLKPSLNESELASKVLAYIDQINSRASLQYTALQIDCDWTESTKEKYFSFLDHLRARSKKEISATIRLHQIKYASETGIPPVDKGILMYYNMGEIAADYRNSIYDKKIATQYTSALKEYPLDLDAALPIFSWGIHMRKDQVVGLLNKATAKEFIHDRYFKMETPAIFEATKSTLKGGTFFEKADRVKIESTTADDLFEMAHDLAKKFRKKPLTVIFYDLDDENLIRYTHDEKFFTEICRTF